MYYPQGTIQCKNLSEVEFTLSRVGLLKSAGDEFSTSRIPGFRRVIHCEADLIEEIACVVGIKKMPSLAQLPFAPSSDADRIKTTLREKVGVDFRE